MRRLFAHIQQKWYHRLSDKIERYIPEEYDPLIAIVPSVDDNRDVVMITLHIPHELTKKLMWVFKPWRKK